MSFGGVGIGRGERGADLLEADSILFSAAGLSSMRTPGRALPPTLTCPTPCTWESFCAMMVEAASYIWPLPSTSEVRAIMKMGESAGFTLR